VARWSEATRRVAREVAQAALAGVGDQEAGDIREDGDICAHTRRALTDGEARGLADHDVRPPYWTA